MVNKVYKAISSLAFFSDDRISQLSSLNETYETSFFDNPYFRRPGSMDHRRRTTRNKTRRMNRMGCIDNIKHWSAGGVEVASYIART